MRIQSKKNGFSNKIILPILYVLLLILMLLWARTHRFLFENKKADGSFKGL